MGRERGDSLGQGSSRAGGRNGRKRGGKTPGNVHLSHCKHSASCFRLAVFFSCIPPDFTHPTPLKVGPADDAFSTVATRLCFP